MCGSRQSNQSTISSNTHPPKVKHNTAINCCSKSQIHHLSHVPNRPPAATHPSTYHQLAADACRSSTHVVVVAASASATIRCHWRTAGSRPPPSPPVVVGGASDGDQASGSTASGTAAAVPLRWMTTMAPGCSAYCRWTTSRRCSGDSIVDDSVWLGRRTASV